MKGSFRTVRGESIGENTQQEKRSLGKFVTIARNNNASLRLTESKLPAELPVPSKLGILPLTRKQILDALTPEVNQQFIRRNKTRNQKGTRHGA